MNDVPITIVAGFLGAGKTTLVNRLLAEPGHSKIAVLVNDFGALDVDARLLGEAGNPVLSLGNGCICCSIRADLVDQVASLCQQPGIDHIVIECSGLSEPGNILRALNYPQLRELVGKRVVVTVVDASTFDGLSGDARYLAGEQLAAADIVLVNKIDLATGEQIAAIKRNWACPGLDFLACEHAAVDTDALLARSESGARRKRSVTTGGASRCFEHATWRGQHTVSVERLRARLSRLPDGLLRVKGFVSCDNTLGKPLRVHATPQAVEISPCLHDESTALVAIGLKDVFDVRGWRASLMNCMVRGRRTATTTMPSNCNLSLRKI